MANKYSNNLYFIKINNICISKDIKVSRRKYLGTVHVVWFHIQNIQELYDSSTKDNLIFKWAEDLKLS
jgi:hypothetical protein